MTPLLIIHKPIGPVEIALEGQPSWTLGRGFENDIILNDNAVSRHHAEIRQQRPGEFVLTDLGSGNGSFVQGQRIFDPHTFREGDYITLGRIQLEFQKGSSRPAHTPHKTVLMMHTSALQGKVWQEILSSQGVAIAHLNPGTDLPALLTQRSLQKGLPDLLLLDMTGIQSNPYHFCRWCRDTYPQVKVILMSGKRAEISDAERRWATHQGAVDLLPGFPEPQLFSNLSAVTSTVRLVLKALDWPEIQQQLLLEALLSIQVLRKQLSGSEANS
ncbi:MAG: FHA domain-containing protein [Thermosynechococcaceae cyanobacterium]